ncbi:uncharacterized protein LOC111368689 [Olea europaea var. sylvestris]|uniref:Uncharacterized protein n=1 Tax=Olea europaea subsp. europaea TaxID=158383 RepID=A0A8S0PRC4_OLEEU|nr:uncharacterized protein LOC111368689 [Olea europaea var. sylvestris]CAA2956872.1 Hypothetical predicted protein [Olea europaea subsp. europaea]
MPLPWNKVKSTRISQLVNGHLQNSQRKRGDSSLMVETGFPTSLVDLFIKNREKLKKPSKKKREKSSSMKFDDAATSRYSPSPMPALSPYPSHTSPSPDPTPLASPLHSPSLLALTPESTGENGGEDVRIGLQKGVDANVIFLAVVKMFLVVVLAFGSKKFAFGFTASAFLLFFVDYVLKHLIGLLKPSLEAQKGLRLRVLKVWRIFSFEEDKFVCKKAGVLKSEIQQVECFTPVYSGLKDCESSFRTQEIQFVGEKCYLPRIKEILLDEIMEESSYDGDIGYVGLETQEPVTELSEPERKKSRRSKIKSKIKKLIPKNFRSSRRKEHSESSEISPIKEHKKHSESTDISPIKEINIPVLEEQEAQEYEDVRALESHSKMSSLSSERYDREDFVAASYCRSDLSKGKEASLNGQQERTKEGQIWIYFVLCLFVLIGLIGGRIFALFLTLFWCLLLKSGETLPRYIKVPRIWSSAKISK